MDKLDRILVADMFGHREIVPKPFDPDERVFIPISELLENLKPPFRLIEGLLETEIWVQIRGPQAKEAALDMAISIAGGSPWRGRRTAQSGVMYITWDGMAMSTYQAACKERGIDPDSLPVQTGSLWYFTARNIVDAVNRPDNPVRLIIVEGRLKYRNPNIFITNLNRIRGEACVIVLPANKRVSRWLECEADADFLVEGSRLTPVKMRYCELQPPVELNNERPT